MLGFSQAVLFFILLQRFHHSGNHRYSKRKMCVMFSSQRLFTFWLGGCLWGISTAYLKELVPFSSISWLWKVLPLLCLGSARRGHSKRSSEAWDVKGQSEKVLLLCSSTWDKFFLVKKLNSLTRLQQGCSMLQPYHAANLTDSFDPTSRLRNEPCVRRNRPSNIATCHHNR